MTSSSSPSSSISPFDYDSDPITRVYWERQESALCGTHCLNNLLQTPLFSEVDMSQIAADLDEKERKLMAEMGTTTPDYLSYMGQESNHVDNSGNFSIEVIKRCLENVGLNLTSVTSEQITNSDPSTETGYICNLQSHWLALRKLAGQWFNLNSLNEHGPEYISDFYISAFLAQLRSEGYGIFVVRGDYPPLMQGGANSLGGRGEYFSIDDIRAKRHHKTTPKPTSSTTNTTQPRSRSRSPGFQTEDEQLEAAIRMSLGQTTPPRAASRSPAFAPVPPPTQSYQPLPSQPLPAPSPSATTGAIPASDPNLVDWTGLDEDDAISEDAQLEAAIRMSLGQK